MKIKNLSTGNFYFCILYIVKTWFHHPDTTQTRQVWVDWWVQCCGQFFTNSTWGRTMILIQLHSVTSFSKFFKSSFTTRASTHFSKCYCIYDHISASSPYFSINKYGRQHHFPENMRNKFRFSWIFEHHAISRKIRTRTQMS